MYVDKYAEKYLRSELKKLDGLGGTDWNYEDWVKMAIQEFEQHSKRVFEEPSSSSKIKIGSAHIKSENPVVKRGQLIVEG